MFTSPQPKALPLKQASDWRPRTPASNLIVPTAGEVEEKKDGGMLDQGAEIAFMNVAADQGEGTETAEEQLQELLGAFFTAEVQVSRWGAEKESSE